MKSREFNNLYDFIWKDSSLTLNPRERKNTSSFCWCFCMINLSSYFSKFKFCSFLSVLLLMMKHSQSVQKKSLRYCNNPFHRTAIASSWPVRLHSCHRHWDPFFSKHVEVIIIIYVNRWDIHLCTWILRRKLSLLTSLSVFVAVGFCILHLKENYLNG